MTACTHTCSTVIEDARNSPPSSTTVLCDVGQIHCFSSVPASTSTLIMVFHTMTHPLLIAVSLIYSCATHDIYNYTHTNKA